MRKGKTRRDDAVTSTHHVLLSSRIPARSLFFRNNVGTRDRSGVNAALLFTTLISSADQVKSDYARWWGARSKFNREIRSRQTRPFENGFDSYA
ncbi:hypothetical protein X777_03980 [Ooceraea biroi]|uniref:Uncharacterized protein n=1 Tax=Ooceraea biroi TaxID=2015173 RepID=A0A026WIG5_OOCBI|nr:hypothetical protein X777_03980 [Ooceraea biroi]